MTIRILNEKHGVSPLRLVLDKASELPRKKLHKHELWILTCYIDIALVQETVKAISKEVRLTDVYLAFNFAEIYKQGPIETGELLTKIEKNLYKQGINFEWVTLASSLLVHSKGYAIFQRSRDEVVGGFVIITSANFTKAGFTGGNVELGYISTKKSDLREFEKSYNFLWDELGTSIDSKIFQQSDYLLKFAILSSGVFLHKWAGSLKQDIGIKYMLTPLAKEKGSIAPELAAVGFQAGDSFTRQVLELKELPEKEVPCAFMKKFTIETYWGRWCPADAWKRLSASFSGANDFIVQFNTVTEPNRLQSVKDDALEVQKRLIEQGLIKSVTEDHLERWMEKVSELRENTRRLERFYTGYDAHDLPYTIEQRGDVLELYDSLEEAISLSKSQNVAKKKVLTAIEERNPKSIDLTEDEIEEILEMQGDA